MFNNLFFTKKSYIRIGLVILISFCFFKISKNDKYLGKISVDRFWRPIYPHIKICHDLQKQIETLLAEDIKHWSITVIDNSRNMIVDINSNKPRIPASNQKLITTAYALNKLGKSYKLKTKLIKRDDGILEVVGQGDPDFNIYDIALFSKKASQVFIKSKAKESNQTIILYEEPKSTWWPNTWNYYDRTASYGSPITRLAITSNSSEGSIQNPIERINFLFNKYLREYGVTPQVLNKNPSDIDSYSQGKQIIYSHKSAPIHALLSLANSESHNFTAEVLLRNAAQTWNHNSAIIKIDNWLKSRRLPLDGFYIADGSGLSRKNRATTLGLSALLWQMNHSRFSSIYKSSFAIVGTRGTLYGFSKLPSIEGRFYGKTGTLNGVRALSGILERSTGDLYISIINNNLLYSDPAIESILDMLSLFKPCF